MRDSVDSRVPEHIVDICRRLKPVAETGRLPLGEYEGEECPVMKRCHVDADAWTVVRWLIGELED